MRKSNWIIAAILVLASVLFLWVWHLLQFNLVDNPLDIIVTVVWWAVIIAACVAIHWAEKRRQERVRTIFVAPGLIYNSERGVIRLGANTPLIDALEQTLASLTYGFDMAELPSNSRVRFQRIVRTHRFDRSQNVWEGEVVEVSQPDRAIPFHSRAELISLIG